MPPHPLIRDSLDSGCEPLRQKRLYKNRGKLTKPAKHEGDLPTSEPYSNDSSTSATTTLPTTTTTTEEPEEEEETLTSTKLVCTAKRNFRSARERWWFVSVSSCNNTRVGDYLKFSTCLRTSAYNYLIEIHKIYFCIFAGSGYKVQISNDKWI